jgi:Fe-S-cluster-containing dehydrogenase component/DMSO reductase anchor subunit
MVGALDRPALIDSLLDDQQRMAVDRFAEWHDCEGQISPALHYRGLIPFTLPKPGEQYAFEVDLDACSGCKACVAACHSLNGLEEDETWRSVGLLHGGTSQLPVIQHVTTACHHCLEPACLNGCPVLAYEKDPSTGIVRHLDDQCIGCQYCILKCPYDVPKYSPTKGIVRKCDMCHGRLAVDEAPACVAACPNQAIRITLVSHSQVRDESEANLFLPGAPEPGYTLPATLYKTKRPLPRNLLPADYYSIAPQHAHLPLVFMLLLTQMSVGALVVDQFLAWLPAPGSADSLAAARAVQSAAAFILGLVGIAAATLHLGRPQYAFRAVIGLRSSWLSREILIFGIFALLTTFYAVLPWSPRWASAIEHLRPAVGVFVAASGIAGIACSVMIYASTRRPFWSAARTSLKFFLTCAVLGLPIALVVWLIAAGCLSELTVDRVMAGYGLAICGSIVVLTALKLLIEAAIFTALASKQFTPLKRTALLMAGELGPTTLQRFAMGLTGGIVLPAVLAGPYLLKSPSGHSPLFVACAVTLSLILLVAGELLERYMFFAAVVVPKMPGAPAS